VPAVRISTNPYQGLKLLEIQKSCYQYRVRISTNPYQGLKRLNRFSINIVASRLALAVQKFYESYQGLETVKDLTKHLEVRISTNPYQGLKPIGDEE
jgi:stress-induced morphogen